MEDWLYDNCVQIMRYVKNNIADYHMREAEGRIRCAIQDYMQNNEEIIYKFCTGEKYTFCLVSSDNCSSMIGSLSYVLAPLKHGKFGIAVLDEEKQMLFTTAFFNVSNGTELCEALYSGFLQKYKYRYDIFVGSVCRVKLFGNDMSVIDRYFKSTKCLSMRVVKRATDSIIYHVKYKDNSDIFRVVIVPKKCIESSSGSMLKLDLSVTV